MSPSGTLRLPGTLSAQGAVRPTGTIAPGGQESFLGRSGSRLAAQVSSIDGGRCVLTSPKQTMVAGYQGGNPNHPQPP
jgi:hypothetical protein